MHLPHSFQTGQSFECSRHRPSFASHIQFCRSPSQPAGATYTHPAPLIIDPRPRIASSTGHFPVSSHKNTLLSSLLCISCRLETGLHSSTSRPFPCASRNHGRSLRATLGDLCHFSHPDTNDRRLVCHSLSGVTRPRLDTTYLTQLGRPFSACLTVDRFVCFHLTFPPGSRKHTKHRASRVSRT